MMRHCDGTDQNLTRLVPETEAAGLLVSYWNSIPSGPPGYVTVACNCGLTFDDEQRLVTWPHDYLRGNW